MNCTVLSFQWLFKIKKLKNNSGLENSSDNGVNRQANSFKRRQFVKTGTKLKGLIIEILAFCFLRIFEYFFISMRHSKIKTNWRKNIFWNVPFFCSSQFWNFMLLSFTKLTVGKFSIFPSQNRSLLYGIDFKISRKISHSLFFKQRSVQGKSDVLSHFIIYLFTVANIFACLLFFVISVHFSDFIFCFHFFLFHFPDLNFFEFTFFGLRFGLYFLVRSSLVRSFLVSLFLVSRLY